jgi:hypothetical protein
MILKRDQKSIRVEFPRNKPLNRPKSSKRAVIQVGPFLFSGKTNPSIVQFRSED